jgi:predicted ATPase
VSPSNPLAVFLSQLKEVHPSFTSITLKPFEFDDLNQYLADALHYPREDVVELTSVIARNTNRNPFYVAQFLVALHKEGLVYYDTKERKWKWDLPNIRMQRRFSGNVVDLLVQVGIEDLLSDNTI